MLSYRECRYLSTLHENPYHQSLDSRAHLLGTPCI
jgi:hypothetical protein